MRWYCVHPSLPSQAELRIRAAPDSSAEERARISQGRAIGACSPAFQVPSDDAAAGPVSWLQVAYLDSASGETEGGFMMAELPDGMALVTPWEETDFTGCCEVTDPGALLFDGPDETARSLGAVPSIDFLYCTLEERGSRFRLFHPELASVWINKNSLQIVCTRLKHAQCCTSHSFYELNEALPEEAQVAIRESPSKEAQTTGLLSRGETLEVTVRSGNWLQISGGGLDRAWIMWRTDALELLQEAPDVWAKTCKIIAANTVDDDDANGDAADKNTTDKNVNTSNHGNDCPLLSENINNTNQDSTIDREAPRNPATDQARVNVDDVEVGAELDTDPAPDAVRTVADDVDDGAMEVGAVVDTVAASDPVPTGADNAKVNDIEVGAKLYTDPALYNVSVEPDDVKLDDVGVGAEIDADLTADNVGVESDDVEVNDVEVGAEEDANQVADEIGVESDDVEVDDVGVDADDDADQAADDVGVEQEDVEVDDVGVDADDDADQAADDVGVEQEDVEVNDVGVDADVDADQAADDVNVESDDVEVDDVGLMPI
ncbi:unnamed protein product [Phytophthora lilii]|uniref:Unnamed protein product n=1 Tax=Phytophthora lilii TaxID=2077276 RepID=A0A9W6WSH1_9STRA|nr:unnamed protein product [Phytophthora lilii]